VQRFRKKNNLVYKGSTKHTTKTMNEMQVTITDFYNKLNAMMEEHKYEEVWNYDEVGVYFESGLTQTLDEKGAGPVNILTLGAKGMRLTLILCISSTVFPIGLCLQFCYFDIFWKSKIQGRIGEIFTKNTIVEKLHLQFYCIII